MVRAARAERGTIDIAQEQAARNLDKLIPIAMPERIIRQWISVDSKPTVRVPSPPEKVQPQSFIQWGKPSSFRGHSFREEALRMNSVTSTSVGSDEAPEPLKRRRETYSEEGRTYRDIKVNNSFGEPDQYLIVREGRDYAVNGWYGDCSDPDAVTYDENFQVDPKQAQFLLDGIGIGSVGDTMLFGQSPKAPPPLDELNEDEGWVEWRERNLG